MPSSSSAAAAPEAEGSDASSSGTRECPDLPAPEREAQWDLPRAAWAACLLDGNLRRWTRARVRKRLMYSADVLNQNDALRVFTADHPDVAAAAALAGIAGALPLPDGEAGEPIRRTGTRLLHVCVADPPEVPPGECGHVRSALMRECVENAGKLYFMGSAPDPASRVAAPDDDAEFELKVFSGPETKMTTATVFLFYHYRSRRFDDARMQAARAIAHRGTEPRFILDVVYGVGDGNDGVRCEMDGVTADREPFTRRLAHYPLASLDMRVGAITRMTEQPFGPGTGLTGYDGGGDEIWWMAEATRHMTAQDTWRALWTHAARRRIAADAGVADAAEPAAWRRLWARRLPPQLAVPTALRQSHTLLRHARPVCDSSPRLWAWAATAELRAVVSDAETAAAPPDVAGADKSAPSSSAAPAPPLALPAPAGVGGDGECFADVPGTPERAPAAAPAESPPPAPSKRRSGRRRSRSAAREARKRIRECSVGRAGPTPDREPGRRSGALRRRLRRFRPSCADSQ